LSNSPFGKLPPLASRTQANKEVAEQRGQATGRYLMWHLLFSFFFPLLDSSNQANILRARSLVSTILYISVTLLFLYITARIIFTGEWTSTLIVIMLTSLLCHETRRHYRLYRSWSAAEKQSEQRFS
jgi:EamA domain-containing membrane protein RarD